MMLDKHWRDANAKSAHFEKLEKLLCLSPLERSASVFSTDQELRLGAGGGDSVLRTGAAHCTDAVEVWPG